METAHCPDSTSKFVPDVVRILVAKALRNFLVKEEIQLKKAGRRGLFFYAVAQILAHLLTILAHFRTVQSLRKIPRIVNRFLAAVVARQCAWESSIG